MKQIEIVIDDKPVIVKKLAVKKLAFLLSTLENIPGIIARLENKNTNEILASLGQIINDFFPDVVKIVQTSTDIEASEIESWGIADIIIVAEAIYEANQLRVVFDRLKKVKAQPVKENLPSENLIHSNGSTP